MEMSTIWGSAGMGVTPLPAGGGGFWLVGVHLESRLLHSSV